MLNMLNVRTVPTCLFESAHVMPFCDVSLQTVLQEASSQTEVHLQGRDLGRYLVCEIVNFANLCIQMYLPVGCLSYVSMTIYHFSL